MVFSSSIFLLYFLPIFLLAYQFIPKQFKNYFILLASIFFYSWGAPKFLFVILASTIIDFFIVKTLFKSQAENKRKRLLFLSIFINLGLLLYFKYSNFFVENVNSLLSSFGMENVGWTKVLLPIGISFYTFQTLTYSIDVYRGKSKPLEKLADYLLYIMSFPQMIAGPIVRFNEIAKQITNRKDSIDDKLIGFYRFCIGLAKKVLIANVMAEQADLIFNQDTAGLSMGNAWLGILAYTFQIYFDFAGYSDMAIGLGRMMGFRFPENFNSPYTASSITEFWRKWHITLGDFMRDYLYIPLGGNRVPTKARWFFNLWLVFLLSGLWHGASWNFVLWGAFHGMFLILDRLFLIKILKRTGKLTSTLITFIIVMLGWVIFRIEEIEKIGPYFKKLFSFTDFSKSELIPAFGLIGSVAFIFSFITSFAWGKKLENFFFKKENYTTFQTCVLTLFSILLFAICLSSVTGSEFNPFIYFRF